LKNMKKIADARFFRSIYSFFLTFWKWEKWEKCPKNRIFSYFFLCSGRPNACFRCYAQC
jgi:hypothetical protein